MIDFEKYDRDHPEIWHHFKRLCHEAKRKGIQKYSAKSIFELIRWHMIIESAGEFKLNNNYHAYYARKMMKEFPEFKGFFELRKIRHARKQRQSPASYSLA